MSVFSVWLSNCWGKLLHVELRPWIKLRETTWKCCFGNLLYKFKQTWLSVEQMLICHSMLQLCFAMTGFSAYYRSDGSENASK